MSIRRDGFPPKSDQESLNRVPRGGQDQRPRHSDRPQRLWSQNIDHRTQLIWRCYPFQTCKKAFLRCLSSFSTQIMCGFYLEFQCDLLSGDERGIPIFVVIVLILAVFVVIVFLVVVFVVVDFLSSSESPRVALLANNLILYASRPPRSQCSTVLSSTRREDSNI